MPKNVKRKAGDPGDAEEPEEPIQRGPLKKSSKKEKLQEARRNAQAWAQAELNKNDAKKKSQAVTALTDSVESDDDNDDVAKTQARKRVRVEESSIQKPPVGTTKLQSARDAAKKWAEEEKMKMEHKTVPAGSSPASKGETVGKSPARTPKPSTGGRKKKLAPQSTPVGTPAVGVDPMTSPGFPAQPFPNPTMGTVYSGGPFMVQQPGQGGTPYVNGGYVMLVQGTSPFALAVPSSGAADDDDDVPPPPQLEHHVSQQILGNAQASLRNQPTVDSFHPDVHKAAVNAVGDEEIDETAGEDDNEPIVVDGVDDAAQQAELITPKKRGAADRITKWTVVFAAIAISVYVAKFPIHSSMFFGDHLNNEAPTLHCFFDSETGWDGTCPDGDGVPCPTGGVCRNGELVKCSSLFHTVSVEKDSCILAEKYKILTAALVEELETYAKRTCEGTNLSMHKYATMLQKHPEIMVEESPELVELVLGAELTVETDDDGLYIGLPEDHSLELPMSCYMDNAFKRSLETIGSLVVKFMFSVWSVFLIILGVLWNCTWTYPLSSLIGFMTVCAIGAIKKAEDKKRKKILDTANMRQMAYRTLQDNPQCPHLVVHIRDEIAFCLAETDKNERRQLIKDIWPKVVSDIKLDNRVRKSQRMVDGVPSDAWQWVAATTPKSARFASET
jgi:hypothetical protein